MVEITQELIQHMERFQAAFHDIVPLLQIPAATTNEQLIAAIQECLDKQENLLPKIFGYSNAGDVIY